MLDLANPATFRDLTKPMGAQTEGRLSGFLERYQHLEDPGPTGKMSVTDYFFCCYLAIYLERICWCKPPY